MTRRLIPVRAVVESRRRVLVGRRVERVRPRLVDPALLRVAEVRLAQAVTSVARAAGPARAPRSMPLVVRLLAGEVGMQRVTSRRVPPLPPGMESERLAPARMLVRAGA